MKLPFFLAMLFAAQAGAPAIDVPPELRRANPRSDRRPIRSELRAWRRERAERALARLDVARAGRLASPWLVRASGWRSGYLDHVAQPDPRAWFEYARPRNAAKRVRQAIRAAGGQA